MRSATWKADLHKMGYYVPVSTRGNGARGKGGKGEWGNPQGHARHPQGGGRQGREARLCGKGKRSLHFGIYRLKNNDKRLIHVVHIWSYIVSEAGYAVYSIFKINNNVFRT